MKIKVIKVNSKSWGYRVELSQGVQSFQLSFEGRERECQWYAKMFRYALKKHDEEQKQKSTHVGRTTKARK